MIERQPFGRSGTASTRAIFGAAALAKVTQDEADETLEVLLRTAGTISTLLRATAMRNCDCPVVQKHPRRFFLGTKAVVRTYDEAKREIDDSLERMGVERVDLIQLHSLADPIEWDVALSPKGAVDAWSKRANRLSAVHRRHRAWSQIAATHLRSLERFDFDSVLLPFSYITMQDASLCGRVQSVRRRCGDRNVAVQTIKSIAVSVVGVVSTRARHGTSPSKTR